MYQLFQIFIINSFNKLLIETTILSYKKMHNHRYYLYTPIDKPKQRYFGVFLNSNISVYAYNQNDSQKQTIARIDSR